MNFKRTLDDPKWLAEHTPALRELFPVQWVYGDWKSGLIDMPQIKKLRKMGLKWRSDNDFLHTLHTLMMKGVLEFAKGDDGRFIFRLAPVDTEISITA